MPPPAKIMPEEAAATVNFSKLSMSCGVDKDIVKSAVTHMITRIGEVVRENQLLMLEFENIGTLLAKNGVVDFRFNIGRRGEGDSEYFVGDGNATFSGKAPASALGLKVCMYLCLTHKEYS